MPRVGPCSSPAAPAISVRTPARRWPRSYNLGNGQGYSVREVISAVERVTALAVPCVLGPRRSGDPAALISDATRARDELDWQPRLADLDEIIRTAWGWHQKLGVVSGG